MADETQTQTEDQIAEADVQAEPVETTTEEVAEASTESAESNQSAEVAEDAIEATEQAEQASSDEIIEEGLVEESAAPVTTTIPDFRAGDTLRLGVRIREGDKTRIQYFEGIVLSRKGMGVNKTFIIRKIGAGGIAVERIFPLYSPALASFEVRRRGMTRRAKVYFLRDIVGSTANVIKERKVVRDHTEKKAVKSQKKADKAAKKATQTKTTKTTGTRSAKRSANKTS